MILLTEQAARIEQLEKALKEFGRHDVSCHWLFFEDQPCDCGLHYAQGREANDET